MEFFKKYAPNLFPETLNKDEGKKINRRDFLKMGTVSTLGSVSLFESDEVFAKDDFDSFKINEISKRKFIEYLNNKNIPHTLKNPKADDISVYNNLEKIMKDWHVGEFTKNESKYYIPKTFTNRNNLVKKYKTDEDAMLKSEGFRKFNLKADYLSVGEIQGGNSDDFITKGFVVLKKGTELYTRSVNGVKQTYLAECFNQLYAGEPLCPPCPEGVMCKK